MNKFELIKMKKKKNERTFCKETFAHLNRMGILSSSGGMVP